MKSNIYIQNICPSCLVQLELGESDHTEEENNTFNNTLKKWAKDKYFPLGQASEEKYFSYLKCDLCNGLAGDRYEYNFIDRQQTENDFKQAVESYLQCAKWTEEKEHCNFSEQAIKQIEVDVQMFINKALREAPEETEENTPDQIGHYFWLSRNGHGSGFFDNWHDKLQEIARSFKPLDLYEDEKGMLNFM